MYYTRRGITDITNKAMTMLGFVDRQTMTYTIQNESHQMEIYNVSYISTSSNQRRNTLTSQDLVDLGLADAPAEVENTDR